jgi:hypothetical protein
MHSMIGPQELVSEQNSKRKSKFLGNFTNFNFDFDNILLHK